MNHAGILFKDFSDWVEGLTAPVRKSGESWAKDLGIEVRYLTSNGGVDKDELARQIAKGKKRLKRQIIHWHKYSVDNKYSA